jgi:glycosyltransferase involved in cell wall biosynthesis
LHRSALSRGLIVQRNTGARLAKGDIIFSIDDDAEFSNPTIVEAVLGEFSDPRIGAIAIPFINVRQDQVVRQKAPDAKQVWVTNEYIGTAHALRKAAFWAAGGYREVLFHQGEEGDLCIRMLEHDYVVRLGSSEPIFHYESPKRSHERINVYGQRNLMLFAWHNVPAPDVLIHLPVTVINGLLWGIRKGWFSYRLQGTLAGLISIWGERANRMPVSISVSRLFRRLKKCGPLSMDTVAPQLSKKAV